MRLPDQLPVKFNMELLLLDEPSATSVPPVSYTHLTLPTTPYV